MDNIETFFGKTKYWWAILIGGIVIAVLGCWMFFYPLEGYIFIAQLFGWVLLFVGLFEIVVSTNIERRLPGWGWWLAGGIIDVIIGIILIGNLALSEVALPYFFGFIFLFKGIESVIASLMITSYDKYWWLYMLNGILMIILGWMFLSSVSNPAFIIDFLVSIVFVYWGIVLALTSYTLKPKNKDKII